MFLDLFDSILFFFKIAPNKSRNNKTVYSHFLSFIVFRYDKEKGNFTFGKGGNQGARGNDKGGDYYIQDVFEELDYPGEYFYNATTKQLYLWHNGTGHFVFTFSF